MTMKRPPAGCQERRRVGDAPRVRRRSEHLRVPLSSSSSHGKTTLQTWTANWRNKRRDKRRSCLSTVYAKDFNGKKNIQSNRRNGKGRRNDTWGALKEPRTNSLLFATTKEEREREGDYRIKDRNAKWENKAIVQKQQTSRRKSHHGSDNPLPTTTTTELRICIRQKRFSLHESERGKKLKKQEAAARTKERKSRCELQKRSQQHARARHFVFIF